MDLEVDHFASREESSPVLNKPVPSLLLVSDSDLIVYRQASLQALCEGTSISSCYERATSATELSGSASDGYVATDPR